MFTRGATRKEYEPAWLDSMTEQVQCDLRQLEERVANKSMKNFSIMNAVLILAQIINLNSIRNELASTQTDSNQRENFNEINQKIKELTENTDLLIESIKSEQFEKVKLLNVKLDRILDDAKKNLEELKNKLGIKKLSFESVQKQCLNNSLNNLGSVLSSSFELSRNYKILTTPNKILGMLKLGLYGAISFANLYFYKNAGDRLKELILEGFQLEEFKIELDRIKVKHTNAIAALNQIDKFNQLNQKVKELNILTHLRSESIQSKNFEKVRLLNMKINLLLCKATIEMNQLKLVFDIKELTQESTQCKLKELEMELHSIDVKQTDALDVESGALENKC